MTDKTGTSPAWAVSDAEAEKLIPESGFIRDYMHYMRECTDAPMIFHYGVISTILSCATSGADILWTSDENPNKTSKIITPMWSALIGVSGAARKSSCMNKGAYLLRRAKAIDTDPEVFLPGDGSLEGWHDFMCEHPQVVLHRDELSVLFDMARRGYSEGVKNWMMEIHSGLPKRRVTRKDAEAKEEKIIERPRLTVLGGIPPAVFSKVAVAGDWNSGFLARFAFWPGEREWFKLKTEDDSAEELRLYKWLYHYAISLNGYITVNDATRDVIDQWFLHEIEERRQSLPPGLYSHFVRYQDLGLRIAAMQAVALGRRSPKDSVRIKEEDTYHAVDVLNALMRATECLFQDSGRDSERVAEDDLLNLIRGYGRPVTPREILDRFPISSAQLHRRLNVLVDSNIIRKKKDSSKTVGRTPWLYFC
jgi:hypothetical protein